MVLGLGKSGICLGRYIERVFANWFKLRDVD